jgi:alkanesulfonate monooxygenase SsuD/methylene tetrahydromethanopterin reductase-like flavin-dependent oxidoreductase (luciferase family)
VTRPLLVGIQLPEVEWEVPFPEMIRMAQTAESVGFDSVWLGDHLLYDLAVGPRGPWEVWTTLAALAASTERVLLGPLVASAGFHEPTMLAKLAATVDGISGGRLILGLGSGWNEREYRAFGFPFDRRVSRFAEAFTIIRTLLADGEIDFAGEFYTAEKCVLHPRATRPGGPPLMVGSVRPRMLSITLPYVDAWNVWWSDYGNTTAGFAELKAKVDQQVVEHGREAGSVSATCAVLVQLPTGDGRQMGAYGEAPVEPIRGSASEVAERIGEFAAAGAEHVQICVDPITRDSIEWFAEMFAVLDR